MSDLKLTFFGIPQIERNGERIMLDTRKALALLAYIALHKRAHSREKLTTLFWPESPANKAFTNLRQTLWVLKKHLTETWLDIRRYSVEIKGTPSLWIDVQAFHQHLEHAATHDHSPTTACPQCLPSLVAAIDLYTDDFLQGFTLSDSPDFDDWQCFQTDLLREKLIESVKKLVRFYASQHDLPHAIRYARQWLVRCPCEEAAHRELMRLYVLNQQRAAALQQYEDCTRILKEEFDAVPEQQTRDLYDAILNQQRTSLVTTPERLLNTGQISSHTEMPYQPTPFIGRTQDIKEIMRLLRNPECRVLTLLGLGGIGKTRLAQQIVPEMIPYYADGVYFLALATVSSPEHLLPVLVDTLQISPSSEEVYRDAFFQYLAQKKLLLILDNFEHLIAGKDLLIEMLRHAPDMQLLVTSQERLYIREEWVYEVSGLLYPSEHQTENVDRCDVAQLPEAEQVFVQSARRRYPEFALTAENTPYIIRLCQLVDGMPLALELAASRCNILSCRQIVEEIERSLDFLVSHTAAFEPRHHSVRAVFESLWKRISPQEQKSLCALSVFQGDFDTHTAHAITGMSLTALAALVDRSLLYCHADGRFAIHPLLQRFLREKSQNDIEEYTSTSEAFCHFYAEFLHQQESRLKTAHQQDALHTITVELPNILQAWQWALTQQHLDTLQTMMPGLALFYEMQSRFQEGKAMFQKTVAHLSQAGAELSNPLVLLQLMVQHAVFAKYLVYEQDVISLYQDALPLLKTHQQPSLALTCIQVGWLKRWHSLEMEDAELHEAEQWILKGKQLAETKGDTWEVARALFVLGDLILHGKVNEREAEQVYQQSLELRQRIGDLWGQAVVFNSLGEIAHRFGLYQKAQWYHREALRICQALHDWHGIAWARGQLANIATNLGEYHEAWTLSWEGYHLATRFGNQMIPAWLLLNLGRIAFEQGDYDEALNSVQQSRMTFQRIHHRWGPAAAILQLGQIFLEQGHLDEAECMFRESLKMFQAVGDTFGETSAVFQLGMLSHAVGNHSVAFEYVLTALKMAHEKKYLLNLLRWLWRFGHMLVETTPLLLGIEVLSFVAHNPATPYNAKKSANVLLKSLSSKQERPPASNAFQTAVEAGKRATVDEIMKKTVYSVRDFSGVPKSDQ